MYGAGPDSLILLLSHFNEDLKVIIMLVAHKKIIISRAREKQPFIMKQEYYYP